MNCQLWYIQKDDTKQKHLKRYFFHCINPPWFLGPDRDRDSGQRWQVSVGKTLAEAFREPYHLLRLFPCLDFLWLSPFALTTGLRAFRLDPGHAHLSIRPCFQLLGCHSLTPRRPAQRLAAPDRGCIMSRILLPCRFLQKSTQRGTGIWLAGEAIPHTPMVGNAAPGSPIANFLSQLRDMELECISG